MSSEVLHWGADMSSEESNATGNPAKPPPRMQPLLISNIEEGR